MRCHLQMCATGMLLHSVLHQRLQRRGAYLSELQADPRSRAETQVTRPGRVVSAVRCISTATATNTSTTCRPGSWLAQNWAVRVVSLRSQTPSSTGLRWASLFTVEIVFSSILR